MSAPILIPITDPRHSPRSGVRGQMPVRPVTISAAELERMVFPPLRFIVPGYLVEGCTLVAGRPKLGKSWLVDDWAIAVATGGYTMGDAQCEQGEVLLLALEDNRRRLQRRIHKIMTGRGIEWPSDLHIATEWPRADQGGLKAIEDWIIEHPRARLVVIDVLAMFRAPKAANAMPYEADYAAVKQLQELASRTGVAIAVVTHTRKSMSEADPFEKVSGTLGLTGAADSTLILDADASGKTLYGRGRDIEEFDHAVTFDPQTCRWAVIGNHADVRRTDERTEILDLLREAEEPMTPGEIADALGKSRNNVKQLLFKMGKAGEVRKLPGRGKYVHPDRTDLDNHVTPP